MSDIIPQLSAALADKYALQRELGRGGMATVYLARDLRHERLVALKVLHPELAAGVGTERFLREIRLAAGLQHPHILPVFDSGDAGGLLWYAMPHVAGESLAELLEREVQLPVPEALRITREVAEALAEAHDRGIIHRDVKPSNILLSHGHALLSDFGIAAALEANRDGHLTESGIVVGTPVYMSPEQASGARRVDGRSDIYSLGCAFYEMLVGEPPFTGPTAQAIMARRFSEVPRPVRTTRPEVPQAVERVVATMLASAPADRFQSASQLADAVRVLAGGAAGNAESPAKDSAQLGPYRFRWHLGATAILFVAAVATIVGLYRSRPASALDPNLVVVAPFDVVGPGLQLWREGLVDVLSRNLDGAGPLRTVSPTVVVRRWSGAAGSGSAADLGRRTGARLTIAGQLLTAGPDSIRLSATLLDAMSERVLTELEVRDRAERIDRAIDSLTLGLLRALGETRPISGLRTTLASGSLPALKAFLQGEQYYRRGAWDSAQGWYRRSIALDSTFALAYRRLGKTFAWSASEDSAHYGEYMLQAARRNRGLTARESSLVVADSFWVVARFSDVWGGPPETARFLNNSEQMVRRYPEDPEVWYEHGEAYFHFGPYRLDHPVSLEQMLAALDRSLALDSAFAPTHLHRMELALNLHGPTEFARSVEAYSRLRPEAASGAELAVRLVNREPSGPQALDHLIAGQSSATLWEAYSLLKHWPDSAEIAVRLARRLAAGPDGARPGFEPHLWRRRLAVTLAYRGHLREARELAGPADTLLFVALAHLNALPRDVVRKTFSRWLADSNPWLVQALGWWEAAGDTLALSAAIATAAELHARGPIAGRPRWGYVQAAAQAHKTLAQGLESDALTRFESLPDSLCSGCIYDRLARVRLMVRQGRQREAAKLLVGPFRPLDWFQPNPAADALWICERARVAERVGNLEEARRGYHFIAALWRNGDPELQPYVIEARQALSRLASAPRT